MSISDKFSDLWQNKASRYGMVAIAVVSVLGVTQMFMSSSEPEKAKPSNRKNLIQSNIFDNSTVDVIQKKEADEYYNQQKKDLDQQRKELKSEKDQQTREMAKMMSRLDKLSLDLEKTKRDMAISNTNNRIVQAGVENPRVTRANESGITGQSAQNVAYQGAGTAVMPQRQYQQITRSRGPETNGMIRTITQSRVSTIKRTGEVEEKPIEVVYVDGKGGKNAGAATGKKTAEGEPKKATNPEIEKKKKAMIKEQAKTFIPAGSIISGVMLNGVDAPTALSKSATPLAVTIRVKLDVLMPNQYTADLQDCFVSGSVLGGDLASERAYIRSLSLNCINTAGEAIETSMQGYAVSDFDGRQGIRGTVVSRAGTALLATFGASFLSAVANASKPTAVSSLNTSPTGSTTFQAPDMGNVAQSGLYGGISGGTDRLAQYAISIAEQQWPVIEISPGTPITFFLEQGMSLPVSG